MKLLSRTWIMGLAFGVICSAAFAQANWPTRPIKLLVPYGPGSSPDVIARIISEKLATRLGQPVIIDNRVGAGGNTGTGAVAKAAGDGYTFLISTNGPLVYNTVLYKKLNYDPFTELRPVVLAGGQSNVCAVRSDTGINTLTDLVNAMRSKPGQFNFSSTGIGSLSQLGVELLKVKTDTFAVHIPYNGGNPVKNYTVTLKRGKKTMKFDDLMVDVFPDGLFTDESLNEHWDLQKVDTNGAMAADNLLDYSAASESITIS